MLLHEIVFVARNDREAPRTPRNSTILLLAVCSNKEIIFQCTVGPTEDARLGSV